MMHDDGCLLRAYRRHVIDSVLHRAIGSLICPFGFAFAAVLIVARLVFGSEWAVHGVFTLFAVMFVFVGAQFIGMGLLGEYLGGIYYDVRSRPRYSVSRVWGECGLESASRARTPYSMNAAPQPHIPTTLSGYDERGGNAQKPGRDGWAEVEDREGRVVCLEALP